ncbi:hypothetical protein DITRI_Ditri08aG0161900 [Diplodiscus trichospermus]
MAQTRRMFSKSVTALSARLWPIVCSIRKKGYYKKPVFSSGWRKLVISNNFNVGDVLTMYKAQDEAGSFHYMIQVENPARPSRDLPPRSFSLNHEVVDENTGTSQTEAISELPDIAADAPVAFIDHVIAKSPSGIFGTNVIDEADSKAHFKSEHEESKIKVIGITKRICMVEPQLVRSYCMTNEEREIKFFGLAEDGAMAYGTSQAIGDAYYKSSTKSERLSLDLTLGLPTPYTGEVNLDLSLAPPVVDGGN